jgi:ABC-type Co2+ transport system permease subunit
MKNEKNCQGFCKKQFFVSKNREKTRFVSFIWTFQLQQMLIAIIKGNFSALAVKLIREKSKNPPY